MICDTRQPFRGVVSGFPGFYADGAAVVVEERTNSQLPDGTGCLPRPRNSRAAAVTSFSAAAMKSRVIGTTSIRLASWIWKTLWPKRRKALSLMDR